MSYPPTDITLHDHSSIESGVASLDSVFPNTSGNIRLDGIQVLRAYAAWLVVFHHFHQVFNDFDRATPWGRILAECGDYAVYVFFVISGFIIHHTVSRRPFAPLSFFRRRVARIAVPYWVATLLFTIIIFLMLGNEWPRLWNLKALVMSMLFVTYPHPSGFGLFPILAVGWSLNFEVLFYALVTGSLVLLRQRWMLPLSVLLLALPWIWRADWPYGAIFSNPIWMLFPTGMALSRWMIRATSLKLRYVISGIALLGITALTLASPIGTNVFVKMALATTLMTVVVWGCEIMTFSGVIWRGAVRLGDWSYTTYLVHPLILFVIERSPFMAVAVQHKSWIFATSVFLVLGGSWVFRRWVERPVLRLSTNTLER